MLAASIGNKAKGVPSEAKPLPKTLAPVLIAPGLTLFFSIPSALDLLALIVDGAVTAVPAIALAPKAGN